MERLPLLFRIIRIVAPVEPRSQFRIAKDFIRFIDVCHLLGRLLFAHPQGACLVRVVLFGHGSISFFNGAVVGVRGDAQDFVVVFGLAAFEQGVSFLEERLYVLSTRMVFFCEVEGADGGFEVFGIQLALCLSDETGERVGVQGESFGTVGSCLFLVDLVSMLVQMLSNCIKQQGFVPPCSIRKSFRPDGYRAHSENSDVCSQPP